MYKWDASDYRQHSQAQMKLGLELINKLDLKGFERVLDIGCGDGKLTFEIAKQLTDGSVLGIDTSAEMINLALKIFSPTDYANLEFIVMDASKLSFHEEFDIAYSNAALHWLKDHKPVLKGIYNGLKKGGRVLLQMGGRGNVADLYATAMAITGNIHWNQYFQDFKMPWGFYGVEEYSRWLNEAGFTPLRVELIPKDMVQPGRDGLLAWMRTTWLGFTQRLPEELRQDFLEQIVDMYIHSHRPDADGQVHVTMIRLEVEAVKNEL